MSVSSNILISLSALAEIIRFDLSNPGKETAGLLIGEENAGVVHIDEIRVGEQKGNAVHVEISDQELTQAAIEISERKDGKVIVGWWHTHPGLTAFLSSTDIKTQTLYQAFMPNAVALVVDVIKYSKTYLINDLDLGVFRVIDNQTQRMPYAIKESVEFGLQAAITGESQFPAQAQKPSKEIYIPIISQSDLKTMKIKINSLKDRLSPTDIEAIHVWLELAESMQDGTIREVPIDIANINDKLFHSLGQIEDRMLNIEDLMFNKTATRSLFAIVLGIIIEFLIFIFILS